MGTDNDAHARQLLDTNRYVTIATADEQGSPWATPVWFAPDGLDRILWLSWPGSRHSQLIASRPEIALTVFDSTVVPGNAAALYATARAALCPDDLLDHGLSVLNERSVAQGLPAFTAAQVSPPARLRLYAADLVDVWVLDQDADVDQRAVVPR